MQFLANVLGALNRLYKIQGGVVSTDRIDLDGSLQPVHNVSREVELASGVGRDGMRGWWLFSIPLNVTGAGTFYGTTVNPYTLMAAFAQGAFVIPDKADVDIWIMDVFVQQLSTPNVITNVAINLAWPNLPGISSGSPDELIFYSATAIPINSVGGGADVFGYQPAFKLTVPRFCPLGCTINARTVGTAVDASCNGQLLCYICPKGTTPPGVA